MVAALVERMQGRDETNDEFNDTSKGLKLH
jgi:hypothetical protein